METNATAQTPMVSATCPLSGKTACLPAWLALSLCRLVYYLATAWAHGKVLPTPFKYGKGDNLAVL